MPEAHIHADHDMTDPARPPSVELELLLRYLDGDLAPDEQRAVDERLATDREHRVALDALAHAFPHAASRSGPWSSDALLRRVEAQLVEHPRLASRPRPVTRLHVVRAHREPPRWWLRAAAVAPRYNRLSKTLSVIGDIFGFARHAFGIVTIARRRGGPRGRLPLGPQARSRTRGGAARRARPGDQARRSRTAARSSAAPNSAHETPRAASHRSSASNEGPL